MENPIGLQNLGVTCWFNSFIQGLLTLPIVVTEIRSIKNKTGNSLAVEFIDLSESRGPVTNPSRLLHKFRTLLNRPNEHVNRILFGNRQEDAQEGMILFLELFKSSDLDKLLNHRYNIIIRCSCGHEIKSIDRNCFIMYPPQTGNTDLRSHILSSSEMLKDYRCDRCATRGSVARFQTLGYSPPVLMIILNKYRSKSLIDLPKSFDIPGPGTYRLVGCIEHSGGMSGGHYWYIGRRGSSHFMLNDTSVTPISSLQPTQNTYIAIYENKK